MKGPNEGDKAPTAGSAETHGTNEFCDCPSTRRRGEARPLCTATLASGRVCRWLAGHPPGCGRHEGETIEGEVPLRDPALLDALAERLEAEAKRLGKTGEATLRAKQARRARQRARGVREEQAWEASPAGQALRAQLDRIRTERTTK